MGNLESSGTRFNSSPGIDHRRMCHDSWMTHYYKNMKNKYLLPFNIKSNKQKYMEPLKK